MGEGKTHPRGIDQLLGKLKGVVLGYYNALRRSRRGTVWLVVVESVERATLVKISVKNYLFGSRTTPFIKGIQLRFHSVFIYTLKNI